MVARSPDIRFSTRNRFSRPVRVLTLLVAAMLLSLGTSVGQETRGEDEAGEKAPAKSRPWLDFSFDYEPEELYRNWQDYVKWRRILGPVGIGDRPSPPRRTDAQHPLGPQLD